MKAAEQRPIAAHGFNRGCKFTRPSKPRQGRQNQDGRFLSPLTGLLHFARKPTACAAGCFLPPLRGCAELRK
jgi:hypothetical protein